MKKIDMARVVELARKGLNGSQIAERLGVRRGAIYAACNAAGTPWAELSNTRNPKHEGGKK